MAAELDPSAERLMHLSSELLRTRDVVMRQRRMLWGMAVALRAERQASAHLIDMVDTLLSELDSG